MTRMSCYNKCYAVHLLCRICRKLDVKERQDWKPGGLECSVVPAWGCFAGGALSPAGMEGMLCLEWMIHPSAICVLLLCLELQSIQRVMPCVLLNSSPPCEGEGDTGCLGFLSLIAWRVWLGAVQRCGCPCAVWLHLLVGHLPKLQLWIPFFQSLFFLW